jgi:hypothetical protein
MFSPTYFERLIETMTLLVRHSEYPMKRRVLEQCRTEVTDLIRSGRVTVLEAEMLYEILDTYPLATTRPSAEPSGCDGPRTELPARADCPACAGSWPG